MKVSARNVFKGTISQLQPGAVNAEVSLKLSGGNELVAVVTMESVKNLGLAVGCERDGGDQGVAYHFGCAGLISGVD
nr:TOBE domain-containing protein [Pseudomonas sp.]